MTHEELYETAKATMTCWGVADAHGIESFKMPEVNMQGEEFSGFEIPNEDLKMLHMRVLLNRHRHAVIYMAEVELSDVAEIQELLEEGEYEEALRYLKACAVQIRIGRGQQKSWDMIPDSRLDPHR